MFSKNCIYFLFLFTLGAKLQLKGLADQCIYISLLHVNSDFLYLSPMSPLTFGPDVCAEYNLKGTMCSLSVIRYVILQWPIKMSEKSWTSSSSWCSVSTWPRRSYSDEDAVFKTVSCADDVNCLGVRLYLFVFITAWVFNPGSHGLRTRVIGGVWIKCRWLTFWLCQ